MLGTIEEEMPTQITISESQTPLTCSTVEEVMEALSQAASDAEASERPNIVHITAITEDTLSVVVGAKSLSNLGFQYAHGDPPYYSSRGISNVDEPFLVAFALTNHHTEIPQRYVIPVSDAFKAVRQFLETNSLPTCVQWSEI
ncbi:Imm1 family immunity protein [Pseudaestuariivita rosea]|uniref:Imm1 family immunity protein n=1 Tax=Pseudaestuariivita rosea TaxID=2763263 RepID=UPI001ABACE06|nr:Imm1 family immunity protein [Pseudaestuariivita rosea]